MPKETQVLTAKYYRKSESKFPYFSTVNGGQWKQVKPRVKYEHQSFFFHTVVMKLVQALVMAYEQIFQDLAAEDVLFSKPQLDLSFNNIIR
jgi:hypothetical protein